MISFLISVHLLLTGGLLTAFEVLPLLLVLIIPYPETFVNKNPNGAALRRRLFLLSRSDPDCRAGIRYLSAFPAASP